ncbi:formylglycine-generating enzyme family protein [Janibacter cremeus]|uniref:Formylglycine-generating enzyme required for sulfatase activity n=1 Tax=Janibacter cremeus TaxID=1285192 RepID=A0A852VWS0_9MICO|nr:formylglycine-generating enzyme family protein [Janibacter cremeus]NYF98694.1 formylglycine-generating enzyme required for sulfatase activity [Janibacter cremeus]
MGTEDMVRLDGGTFRMGSQEFYPEEGPVHEHTVAAFAIDRHAVTNADFAAFVADTGYVTVAERDIDPNDFPGAVEDLAPGGLVFTPTAGPVDLNDWRQWWRWVPGASWRAPEGPGSTVEGRSRHPVVQVAFEDAVSYATWVGKRLPTEAEFEYAAQGGRDDQRFAWGDDPYPGGVPRANTWLGRFPYERVGDHGGRTAPVGSYPPNSYGLVDMIGNVWEWTSGVYTARHAADGRGPSHDPTTGGATCCGGGAPPISPVAALRTIKGGSFLCTPEYCFRFRPAARSPQSEDTATVNIGFRCAR